jgi:hypothetical protein
MQGSTPVVPESPCGRHDTPGHAWPQLRALLQGDVAIVLEIAREVDGRHSALTELSLDAVAVGERSSECVQRGRRHRLQEAVLAEGRFRGGQSDQLWSSDCRCVRLRQTLTITP